MIDFAQTTTTPTMLTQNENVEICIRTKLYVTNFPQHATRRHLTDFFNKFGQVLECAIMWDSYAFIHYRSEREAVYALEQANSQFFMGNRLVIQLSKSKNRQDPSWYQKEASKQLQQTNDSEVSPSTSPSSDSPINIIETKLYVTNLPENCDKNELKLLFEKYGRVLECVIMWNHYAFVHFATPEEANRALKKLKGHLYYGKKLIIQLSTSSNRPLPKCIALNPSQIVNNKPRGPFVFNDLTPQYVHRPMIPHITQSFINPSIKHNEPSTILCYRAMDTDCNTFGVSQQQQHRTLPPKNVFFEKKTNENSCLLDMLKNKFEMASLQSSLLDLWNSATAASSTLQTAAPTSLADYCGGSLSTATNKHVDTDPAVSLDQVPTPPLPFDSSTTPDENPIKNPFEFHFNQDDLSISVSPTTTEATSSSSSTSALSSSSYGANDTTEQMSINHIQQTRPATNTNNTKKSRSRCRILNYLLNPELQDSPSVQ